MKKDKVLESKVFVWLRSALWMCSGSQEPLCNHCLWPHPSVEMGAGVLHHPAVVNPSDLTRSNPPNTVLFIPSETWMLALPDLTTIATNPEVKIRFIWTGPGAIHDSQLFYNLQEPKKMGWTCVCCIAHSGWGCNLQRWMALGVSPACAFPLAWVVTFRLTSVLVVKILWSWGTNGRQPVEIQSERQRWILPAFTC